MRQPAERLGDLIASWQRANRPTSYPADTGRLFLGQRKPTLAWALVAVYSQATDTFIALDAWALLLTERRRELVWMIGRYTRGVIWRPFD